MITVQINERTNIGKNLIQLLAELSKEKKNTVKFLQQNKMSKAEFLADFEQSLNEVKFKKTKPLKDLLNGK